MKITRKTYKTHREAMINITPRMFISVTQARIGWGDKWDEVVIVWPDAQCSPAAALLFADGIAEALKIVARWSKS